MNVVTNRRGRCTPGFLLHDAQVVFRGVNENRSLVTDAITEIKTNQWRLLVHLVPYRLRKRLGYLTSGEE